jgi:hypothetical protein
MIDGEKFQAERWSNDNFLDGLRKRGDQRADECFSALKEILAREDFSDLFKMLSSNDVSLPDHIPQPLRDFLEDTHKLPSIKGKPIDFDRLARGQKVFMTHALPAALVLLAKSLPEGYAAPNLSKILILSDNLRERPYRRLLGVLQMVVNVSAVGGFEPDGKAVITIPKIRLLHAGVRHIVRQCLPGYESAYGVPVNLEDMLGTVMGFSYLVITGLQRLNIVLSDEAAEDFYYLWRVFAQMMGIHPAGEPNSSAFVPADLAQAQIFYNAYRRRHYVAAVANSDGVALAQANLQLLCDMLPQTPLRRLGLKVVPKVYMENLMSREGCALIGIRPVRFLSITNWFLMRLPAIWTRLWNVRDSFDPTSNLHENLSRLFFQGLINREFNGELTFLIPNELAELRGLVGPRDHQPYH